MNSTADGDGGSTGFEAMSYTAHAAGYRNYVNNGELGAHAQSWYRDDTVGAWCARRLRSNVDPLLAAYPGRSWLTVGDGALGTDAHYLASHGAEVLATDISDEMLAVAKKAGYIKAYARENAERLSFGDNSFDFVFCKEAYHHFPRPYLALYELLRVSRMGVVVIEPADMWVTESLYRVLARALFRGLRRIATGKRTPKHSYEAVGNYQYTISIREWEKVALGMNYPMVAYKGVNSFYRQGIEFAPASEGEKVFARARRVIAWKTRLSKCGLLPWGLLVAIIFKEMPSEDARDKLKTSGFTLNLLPRNPYLK